jgi:hypothetical protein
MLAVLPWLAQAQGFAADYRLAPAASLGGETSGAGLSLQAGRNWFGQVGVGQAPVSTHAPGVSADVMNLAGGYRWANGQSLSLQLSRGRGNGQRLGLAVSYDWPHYFVRFAYDQGGFNLLPQQDNLRFSAGVRF